MRLYFTGENRVESNSIILLVIILFNALTSCSKTKTNVNIALSDTASNKFIKVALLQITPVGADLESNMRKGEEYCRKAKSLGADIVLFPEMWSIGYTRFNWPGTRFTSDKYPLSFDDWKAKAIDENSEFLTHFQHLAVELDMAIVITYLEKWNEFPRNSASVIDANGNILITYAKVHTSDHNAMESKCTPGDDFYVCDLTIKGDSVKIGIMTCFDREFPESARILMLKGAELILTPNACGLDDKRINQFQTRAYENAVGVAMTNYPSPNQNGHSCAFNANGDRILVADEEEGVSIVRFSPEKIRAYREKTIFGNAYRRPQKYHLLISQDVDTVFLRNNGLGEEFIRENR